MATKTLTPLDGKVTLTSDATHVYVGTPNALQSSSNLSDVASASTSRANLGLGTVSTHSATDFPLVANNLSDLASASTARTNLGLGTLATQSGTFSGTSSGTNTGDQTISDATITTTDITTNNVSTTKHGFAPKAPNDATKYLDGTGAYTVPAGSGGGTPGGSSGQIQYNNSGAFGGITTTGSGNAVLATSPTLVTPVLGTPTSGTLTNCTGLPVAGGGTGVSALTAHYTVVGAGTSAVSLIAPSTSGYVLTSNGASADPSYQAPASSGSLVKLATYTPSNVASQIILDSFNTSTYSKIILELEGLHPNSGRANLSLRFRASSADLTTATYYRWSNIQSDTTSGPNRSSNGAAGFIQIDRTSYGVDQSSADNFLHGSITISGFNDASARCKATWQVVYANSDTAMSTVTGGGDYIDTVNITGAKLYFNGDNISGTITVYGVAR